MESEISSFADDSKIMRVANNAGDAGILQDLDTLFRWTKIWDMGCLSVKFCTLGPQIPNFNTDCEQTELLVQIR